MEPNWKSVDVIKPNLETVEVTDPNPDFGASYQTKSEDEAATRKEEACDQTKPKDG
jgi:hypothetical protein